MRIKRSQVWYTFWDWYNSGFLVVIKTNLAESDYLSIQDRSLVLAAGWRFRLQLDFSFFKGG
jgi:hypothetical protein